MKLSNIVLGLAIATLAIGAVNNTDTDKTISGKASIAAAEAPVATTTSTPTPTTTRPTPTTTNAPAANSQDEFDDAFLELARTQYPFSSRASYSDADLLDLADSVCSEFSPNTRDEATEQFLVIVYAFTSNGIDADNAGYFAGISIGHSCPAEAHWITEIANG